MRVGADGKTISYTTTTTVNLRNRWDVPDKRDTQFEVRNVFLGLLDDGEKLLLRLVNPATHLRSTRCKCEEDGVREMVPCDRGGATAFPQVRVNNSTNVDLPKKSLTASYILLRILAMVERHSEPPRGWTYLAPCAKL